MLNRRTCLGLGLAAALAQNATCRTFTIRVTTCAAQHNVKLLVQTFASHKRIEHVGLLFKPGDVVPH